LFPFAVYHFRKEGMPKLSLGQWLTFFAAIVCYSSQCTLYVKSLEYTTPGNATIYANSQALLLILGKALVGEHVQWMEAFGAIVAFGGAGLVSLCYIMKAL
jgi:drug/metabolite transporter (DMT)-like permease